ncbi:ATP-binding protein [Microcella indica]|uniref:ATP-binding protein n=1 Tax=Microcella indica TaxID=2750620 RepID=UPI0015CF320F|nr:ATP-binding protein [Microcella indica]
MFFADAIVRRVGIAALVLLAGAVSVTSVLLSPVGAAIAAWWPAAGISVVAVLASRGNRVAAALAIAAVTAAGNVIGGRELLVAVLFGLANAVEAWLVAWVLTRGEPVARLERLRDMNRLLLASVVGAVSIGLLAGLTAWALLGRDFIPTALGLFFSHASALLVITPVALVSPRRLQRVNPWEALLQALTLVGILAWTFWPGNILPLAFLPFIALLWAAFRAPTIVVAVQLILTAMAVTILTAVGGGPFAVFAGDGTRTTVELIQAFLIVYAVAVLYVSAARNEWANVVTQLGAREALLRGGIISSETGILVAEVLDGERLRVVGVNATALEAIGRSEMPSSWGTAGIWMQRDRVVFGVSELDDRIRGRDPGRVEITRGDRRFDVDIAFYAEAGGQPVVTLVFTDVTARDAREQLALAVADDLRRLNEQKDDFIASVSHELRTPVTSILGFAEQLEESLLQERDQQASTIIARNARRLADVIQDVLELSKLSSVGAAPRAAAQLDVLEVVRHCAEDASGLSPARQVQIALTVPEHPVMIVGVTQDIARVCANLLSNAVKFSPDGGTVRLDVIDEGDETVEIRVVDEGPGIPAADLPHVWERFYRVQTERHREVPGTGLGLPIVKGLVETRIGGTIDIESDGLTGTTVILRIPRERAVSVHVATTAMRTPSETGQDARAEAQEGAE